jgi:hypothetical protein
MVLLRTRVADTSQRMTKVTGADGEVVEEVPDYLVWEMELMFRNEAACLCTCHLGC